MNFISKKTALVILGLVALVCSRVMFFLFNDPEGPNLVVVIGMALILFFMSLVAYLYLLNHSTTDPKRLLFTIAIQIMIATGIYFLL